jgi:hypothetical protein
MPSEGLLSEYADLLHIRERAARRDRAITGGVFLLFFSLSIVQGLLTGILGRAAYLVILLVTLFGLSFVFAWCRLEMIRGNLALLEEIDRRFGRG